MTEKEAILKRHSVRAYEDRPIDEETLKLIRSKIDELNEQGNLHLQLIEDAGKTYNKLLNIAMGLGSAPSVIACAGKDDEDLDERVGYYGEKLVLYLTQLGLNTCWAGTFNRKNIGADVNDGERLVISIAVGYGKNQGKPRKSKTAEQVTAGKSDRPDWFKEGVEMALLAPTAINQQKFTIRLNEDDSVDFIDNGGVLSRVDLGIVKCHFEIGAKRE
ncbi:MAG: nitroreductase [Lachnospiraceae bacterium]|nr:nitroreductase [Lachnospiraceae bacterium]